MWKKQIFQANYFLFTSFSDRKKILVTFFVPPIPSLQPENPSPWKQPHQQQQQQQQQLQQQQEQTVGYFLQT